MKTSKRILSTLLALCMILGCFATGFSALAAATDLQAGINAAIVNGKSSYEWTGGDVTLENFLVTHKLVPEKLVFGNKVLVARFEDVPAPKYADIANKLRESGIVCSVYLGAKKFGKQIDYAIKDGYTHVLIMGGDELAAGQFKLKDLEARTEQTYSLSALDDVKSIFN